MLLPLPLLNRELDRQRELHPNALHVGLDLVQMLLTKVLDGVSHGEGLKDGYPVLVSSSFSVRTTLRDIATIRGRDTSDMVLPPSQAWQGVRER